MKTFVTGATGFIGRYVVERLARSGHELRCLVRETSNVGHLEEVGATRVVGDVTDKDSFRGTMKECACAIHLANVYTLWEPDNRIYHRVNVEGTRNVMECALAAKVSKVVHVSSAVVYGKPAQVAFAEEAPVGPVRFSEYTCTKYEGELVAWELYERQRLPLVVIYPGVVMGAGYTKAIGQYVGNLVHRRIPARVLEDSVFTYVDVKDVAEAIVQAAEKQGNIGERYLVGKHQLSLREINEMISEISRVPLPRIRLPDTVVLITAFLLTLLANLIKKPPLWAMSTDQFRMMREGFRFDGSKAEKELGITYTSIQATLEEAIASYRD